jgi:hypothetical protein
MRGLLLLTVRWPLAAPWRLIRETWWLIGVEWVVVAVAHDIRA